jgi:hypothetical protein
VGGEPLLEDTQPTLDVPELDERAAHEWRRPVDFLRDPVRVTDDGELLVQAADLARVPAGQLDEDFEQQRERSSFSGRNA